MGDSGKQTVIVNAPQNVNAQQGPRIDRSQTFFIGHTDNMDPLMKEVTFNYQLTSENIQEIHHLHLQ